MWNWIKRVFSNSGGLLVTAAVAVAKTKLEESINNTDKLDSTEKIVVRELMDQFIADLLAEINK